MLSVNRVDFLVVFFIPFEIKSYDPTDGVRHPVVGNRALQDSSFHGVGAPDSTCGYAVLHTNS